MVIYVTAKSIGDTCYRVSDPEDGMENAEGWTVRVRWLGNDSRNECGLKTRYMNRRHGWRQDRLNTIPLTDGRPGSRTMRVGNAEYLYIIMAATIIIHAAVGTFFGGVMT